MEDGEIVRVVLGPLRLVVVAPTAAVVNEDLLTDAVGFKVSVNDSLEILLPVFEGINII